MVDWSLSISAANGGSWHPSRARAQGIRSVCPQASPSPLDWIGKVWEHWITHPPPPLPTKSANLIGSRHGHHCRLLGFERGIQSIFLQIRKRRMQFRVIDSWSVALLSNANLYCPSLGSHDAYKSSILGRKWIRCCWSWGRVGPRHSGTTKY